MVLVGNWDSHTVITAYRDGINPATELYNVRIDNFKLLGNDVKIILIIVPWPNLYTRIFKADPESMEDIEKWMSRILRFAERDDTDLKAEVLREIRHDLENRYYISDIH